MVTSVDFIALTAGCIIWDSETSAVIDRHHAKAGDPAGLFQGLFFCSQPRSWHVIHDASLLTHALMSTKDRKPSKPILRVCQCQRLAAPSNGSSP